VVVEWVVLGSPVSETVWEVSVVSVEVLEVGSAWVAAGGSVGSTPHPRRQRRWTRRVDRIRVSLAASLQSTDRSVVLQALHG